MTCNELKTLLNSSERERLRIELKSFQKLYSSSNEDNKDIALEISALANAYGGKLIFGVKDDGTFEGSFTADLDKAKEQLHNICFDKISPIVECNIQLLNCDEGDVLIIYVPKRKSMPHACVKRGGKDILSRTYYVRTSHGKRPINDAQLEWLFTNMEEPNFSYFFRIGMEFDKQFNLLGEPLPIGNYGFANFYRLFPDSEEQKLYRGESVFPMFITELMPYLILKSIGDYYQESWYIGISKGFDRTSSGPMKFQVPQKKIRISDIVVTGMTTVDSFSWNFQEVLDAICPKPLCIPPNTELSLYFKEGKKANLKWKNPKFTIELTIGMLSSGAGLHQKSLTFERHNSFPRIYANDSNLMNYRHFDGAGSIHAEFQFPDYDLDEFKRHLHYYESLKELVQHHWDYVRAMTKIPPKETLLMMNKLDRILDNMGKNREAEG